jgi:hypothetical protein
VVDAYQKNYEIAIIVSADSDMIPAIEIVKEIQQKVFIYFPPNQFATNLMSIGNGSPTLLQQYETRFRQSVFPDIVPLSNGFNLHIPPEWKI